MLVIFQRLGWMWFHHDGANLCQSCSVSHTLSINSQIHRGQHFFFFFKDSESWSKMVSLRELWGMTQELPTLVLKNVYPISLAHSLFIHHLFVVSIGKKMSWNFNLNLWMLILYLLRKDTFSYLSFSLPLFQFLNQFLSAESVPATVEMVFVGRTRVFGASSAPFMLLSSYGYSLSDPAFPLEFVSVTVISCILEALW